MRLGRENPVIVKDCHCRNSSKFTIRTHFCSTTHLRSQGFVAMHAATQSGPETTCLTAGGCISAALTLDSVAVEGSELTESKSARWQSLAAGSPLEHLRYPHTTPSLGLICIKTDPLHNTSIRYNHTTRFDVLGWYLAGINPVGLAK